MLNGVSIHFGFGVKYCIVVIVLFCNGQEKLNYLKQTEYEIVGNIVIAIRQERRLLFNIYFQNKYQIGNTYNSHVIAIWMKNMILAYLLGQE